ncbi:MAG: phosphoribosyltransferase [Candidatus Micrarchaeia archaeon]
MEELLGKAIETIEKAKKEGIPLHLIGGLAFSYLAKKGREIKEFSRETKDIDFFSLSKYLEKINKLMLSNGFEEDKRFNALYGAKRMQYYYKGVKVDLLLDEFRMSHMIPLKEKIQLGRVTIAPSDLLLTKLQVAEINEKDIKDILALLVDFKMGNADTASTIDSGYIAELLSDDWGLYKTVMQNLEKANRYLESLNISQRIKSQISTEIEYLRNAIELRPKSIRWKLRAKIGEKVRWYELPEESVSRPMRIEEIERTYIWISFDEMEKLARKMAKKILSMYGKPGAIIYIERGGIVIARLLSKYLGIGELYGVQIVAYEDINRRSGTYILPHYISLEPDKQKYVLLVDDIADTGKTISIATEFFKKKYNIVTATMAYKQRSIMKPNIIGKKVPNNAWIIFDYEKHESLLSFSRQKDQKGLKVIEKSNSEKGYYKGLEERARLIAESLEATPSILLYTKESSIIARLVSDYANIKRVSGIADDEKYISHIAKVCEGMDDKSFALVLSANEELAKRVINRLPIKAQLVNLKGSQKIL